MNQKAEELGMENTHFMNVTGLHDENHYSTVKDMAKLLSYALKNDEFCQLYHAEATVPVPATNIRMELGSRARCFPR